MRGRRCCGRRPRMRGRRRHGARVGTPRPRAARRALAGPRSCPHSHLFLSVSASPIGVGQVRAVGRGGGRIQGRGSSDLRPAAAPGSDLGATFYPLDSGAGQYGLCTEEVGVQAPIRHVLVDKQLLLSLHETPRSLARLLCWSLATSSSSFLSSFRPYPEALSSLFTAIRWP
jgi:hypothetical protein